MPYDCCANVYIDYCTNGPLDHCTNIPIPLYQYTHTIVSMLCYCSVLWLLSRLVWVLINLMLGGLCILEVSDDRVGVVMMHVTMRAMLCDPQLHKILSATIRRSVEQVVMGEH